ncbi:MAG: hypothetical protein JXQ73_07230 [Phycisphaerae bacterium]|nr:hypothetical protein [Phycisphaerae bacterium]
MVNARSWILASAAVWLPMSVGCNLVSLPYVLFAPDPTQKVSAEFAHLKGKRVIILVWAEQATLYEYPNVQIETASHIRYYLREQFQDLDVVSPKEVDRYMKAHPDWATEHPSRIARHFKANCAMMVELMEFTTREPGSPNLFRGRARGRIVVYDLAGQEDQPKGIALKPAEATYPPDQPIGVLRADDRTIRAETYKEFGRSVARKFYDHEVKL